MSRTAQLRMCFVEKGVVSLTADTHDHGQVEVGLTGREGLVGASAILNPKSYSVHRAFTQAEGGAYWLSSTVLRSTVERSATLRDRCLRYLEMLMVQASQVAACCSAPSARAASTMAVDGPRSN